MPKSKKDALLIALRKGQADKVARFKCGKIIVISKS